MGAGRYLMLKTLPPNSNKDISMKPVARNIFKAVPDFFPEELFESVFQQNHVHIERILSQGHCTTPGEWYDQPWDEWVLLIQGQATLLYQEHQHRLHLSAGDYILIPAHTLHRVEWTPADQTTIWLAVHMK